MGVAEEGGEAATLRMPVKQLQTEICAISANSHLWYYQQKTRSKERV